MIIATFLLILSFLFEGFISSYISSSFTDLNIFSTLYTLITLIIIYPYFYNEKKYYILLIIFGLLTDIVYTNTFMINIFIYIAISIIIKFLNFILPENILMLNIMTLFSVITYHVLSYVILTVINYDIYPSSLLINICTNSILMTIIYTSILYIITRILFNKFDIKQIK